MDDNKELFEDWYNILNVEPTATINQIQNAYRKLAKKYHPDKNKTAEAVVMFEKISIAHTTLCNEEKRSIFDSKLTAKREKKRKEMEMDNARKKMKDDLLSREESHKRRKENQELQRKQVSEQNEKFKQDFINQINQQMKQEQMKHQQDKVQKEQDQLVIKLKWKSKLNYTQDFILNLLASYGEVDSFTLVDSPNSSTTIALANFQLLDSILQILLNKEDLKNKFKIKVERFKSSLSSSSATDLNNSDNLDNIIFTNLNSNGININTATSTFKSSSSSTTTTTTTTTTTSTNFNNNNIDNNNNNINNNNNNIFNTKTTSNNNAKTPDINLDDDEDDILLKMKNFKK